METFFLDMAWWPAVYILGEYWSFWYLASVTIIIEMITLYYFDRFSWQQSLLASLTGNLISGTVGALVMVVGMLGWHLIGFPTIADYENLIDYSTTFIFMCLGSVAIETLAIQLIFKKPFRKLFPALLVGNLLTYVFIAYVMIVNFYDTHQVHRFDYFTYLPHQDTFRLSKNQVVVFDTTDVKVACGKNDRVLSPYFLQIPYRIYPNMDSSYGKPFDLRELYLFSLENKYNRGDVTRSEVSDTILKLNKNPYMNILAITKDKHDFRYRYNLWAQSLSDTIHTVIIPNVYHPKSKDSTIMKYDTLFFIRYEPDYD